MLYYMCIYYLHVNATILIHVFFKFIVYAVLLCVK